MERKISEAEKKAKKKWAKNNTYTYTITFYKKNFPVEDYEKARNKIKEMGISCNEFCVQNFKKLLNHIEEVR